MVSNRLTRNDWYFIIGCLVILIGGIFFSRAYFHQAFPEAKIDFKYDRENSQPIAENFLREYGLVPPAGYTHGSAFYYDGYAKTYLEKELGNDRAQKYYNNPVLMWFWFHRWFKPGLKEEFSVQVTPDGKLARFAHLLPEEAAGANLEQDSARKLVENFLYNKYKVDSNRVKYYEVSKRGRPNRTDWSFTYRDATIEPVKGSDYRYYITVQGSQVANFWQGLFVPEAWGAKFKKIRSYNEAAGQVDSIFFVLTMLAIGIVFFIRVRKKDVQWKTAIWFGGIATVLFLVNQLNGLTSGFVWYNTTDPWGGFLFKEIGMYVVLALLSGVGILLLTASTEAMYREWYPNKVALPRMFTIRGLRTKSAFKNILLGLTMCSFFFAYQIAFYLIANHFGAWSPVDVPYDDLLKTSFPWVAVLLMGFFPAVSEEFMSRAFSIPFLHKLFRGKLLWFSVMLASFIWGFGHSTYPNEPWFIRGLEVGIGGIIVGVIMLRFGILAPLVWHYSVDAVYTSFLFFRSSNWYLVVTGAVAAGLLCVPLILAFIAYLRKGSFVPEEGLTNADIGTAGATPEPIEPKTVEPTPEPEVTTTAPKVLKGNVAAAIGLLIVGIIAVLIPVTQLGGDEQYKISSEQAIQVVKDSLRSCGWANPDTLTFYINRDHAAQPQDDSFMKYLLQRVGTVKEANALWQARLGNRRIQVQGFKPESRTKYRGAVDVETGKITMLELILPEEAPGDSLSKDSARTLVENIYRARGIDLNQWELKEYYTEARPKRVDHYFTYEVKAGDSRNFADAKYRMSASVVGNKLIVGDRCWFKVPEKWQREQRATTLFRGIYTGVVYAGVAVAVLLMLWQLLKRTRKGQVPWKRALKWSIIPAVVCTLGNLNLISDLYGTYFSHPEIPWSVFRVTIIVGVFTSSVAIWLLLLLCFASILGLYPNIMTELRAAKRDDTLKTILLAVIASIGVFLIRHTVPSWLASTHPNMIPPGSLKPNEFLYASYPFLGALGTAINGLMILAVIVAFVHYFWQKSEKSVWLQILFIVVAFLVGMPKEAILRAEIAFGAISCAVYLILIYLLLKKVIAGNPLGLLTAIVVTTLLSMGMECYSTGNMQLIIPATIALAMILAAYLNWLIAKDKEVVSSEQL